MQPAGRRLAEWPDLDNGIAELDAMLAAMLVTGSSRTLLSQDDLALSLNPSKDDLLRVHSHLLQLISQAPAASEVFILGWSSPC